METNEWWFESGISWIMNYWLVDMNTLWNKIIGYYHAVWEPSFYGNFITIAFFAEKH